MSYLIKNFRTQLTLAVFIAGLLIFSFAQAIQSTNTETRPLPEFTSIEVGGQVNCKVGMIFAFEHQNV